MHESVARIARCESSVAVSKARRGGGCRGALRGLEVDQEAKESEEGAEGGVVAAEQGDRARQAGIIGAIGMPEAYRMRSQGERTGRVHADPLKRKAESGVVLARRGEPMASMCKGQRGVICNDLGNKASASRH